MRSAPLLSASPPTQKADPNCPRHGIEPEGMEIDMGPELNPQKVAAGMMAGAMMLGLCSCSKSPSPEPTVSPDVGIEQPIEATPTPSPDETVQEVGWEDTGTGWPPMGITFLSVTDANYEFSDEPQDRAEQWIFDHHPQLWERGVRAVTHRRVFDQDWKEEPGALVQYIDGERFEGNETLPLGFRDNPGDPHVVPSDTVADYIRLLKGGSDPLGDASIGQGGYSVFIAENRENSRDAGTGVTEHNDVELIISKVGETKGLDPDNVMRFGSIDEALSWIDENGYLPGGDFEGNRALYPGEVASLAVMEESGTFGNHVKTVKVYDSSKDEWVIAEVIG